MSSEEQSHSKVTALREKLKSGERGGSERDRDVLIEFSNRLQLLREDYGWHRHYKLLGNLTRLSENAPVDIADTLTDRDAAEAVVRWIHSEYDLDEQPTTNKNYRVALRVFGRRVTDDGVDGPNTPPPSIDWISSTLPNSYDPSPDPSDMLTWDDDVQPMLDETRNPRDRAAIALQFDAGLRGGELYDLRVSDITDTTHGLSVSVDGKTGERAVDLIPSTPHVNEWLARHPGGGHDYLWTKLREPDRLSYNGFLDMFRDPADRAGVDKPVTPTNFRKSNLAWLAKQEMNARYIEQRQGRKPGSDAVSHYVGIFDRDIGTQYAKLMGLEVEDEDDQDLAPLTCPRCEKETPRDADRCVWCGQSLKADASRADRNERMRLAQTLAEAEGEDAEKIVELMQLLEEHPWLRDKLSSPVDE